MTRLNAKDEGYGVHEVGFPGTVGANDGGEFLKRANDLFARIGFEIFEFEVRDWHGWLHQ